MDDLTRRRLFQGTSATGVLAFLAGAAPAQADDAKENKAPSLDRQAVLASGMTEEEADCWELAANLAGKFFALPELHPMDKHEITLAIHNIQHRLLSRPTYRNYKETAKKLHEQK